MRIVHRISVNSSPHVRAELARFGFIVPAEGLVTFEANESHHKWPEIQRWVAGSGAVDIITTQFIDSEVLAAEWCQMLPEWHHGYPQPNDDVFGYRGVTFDITDSCSQCGIGLRQVAPFRMAAEPRWGRRGILQLNWVIDEYFVTPAVWATAFKP